VNSYQKVIDAITDLHIRQEKLPNIFNILNAELEHQKTLYPHIELSKIVTVEESITKGNKMLEDIIALKSKYELQQKNIKKAQECLDESERLTGELNKYRQRKKDLYASAKLNPSLEVIGDELFYRIDENNIVPFTADSVSYSVAGIIVIDFILRLNKETPVVLLGNGGEYDASAMAKIKKLSEEYNAIVFADRVTVETPDKNLTIEVYE
jgi:hypothetical protein